MTSHTESRNLPPDKLVDNRFAQCVDIEGSRVGEGAPKPYDRLPHIGPI